MENKFYDQNYAKMFYSKGVASLLTKMLHKSVENRFSKVHFDRILEIGGGEGFHVEYVKCSFTEYYLTDIDLRELVPFARDLQSRGRLIHKREDAHNLSFLDNSFDRILFMCVLHHLSDVEKAMSEARRVTKNGGTISIYLPCDPGFIYVILRRLATFKAAKKNGIDYELMNAREHIGHVGGIIRLLNHVYKGDRIQVHKFPLFFLGHNFNVFYSIDIILQKEI